MNGYEPLINRIRDDVRNGGSLGKASSLRLLDIMSQMAQDIEKLQRDRDIERSRVK